MTISKEAHDKIQGLRLVGLYDVLINANRIEHEDGAYDLGVKHGVHLLTDRILEEYQFSRQEIRDFYQYAEQIESSPVGG